MLLPVLAALQLAATAPAPAPLCPGQAAPLPNGSCPGLVFFDSGQSEIRREWNPVLDHAASSRAGRRLAVTGHSDTPGPAAANHRLARARAEAVAAALVARGVPREAIAVGEEGEDRLLVPTAEGVREIHNRRVEIHPLP